MTKCVITQASKLPRLTLTITRKARFTFRVLKTLVFAYQNISAQGRDGHWPDCPFSSHPKPQPKQLKTECLHVGDPAPDPSFYPCLPLLPCGQSMFTLVLLVYFQNNRPTEDTHAGHRSGLGFTGQGAWVPRYPECSPKVEGEAQAPGCMFSWPRTLFTPYLPYPCPARAECICVLKPPLDFSTASELLNSAYSWQN